ncbi:hypothetical protein ACHAXR_001003 [Thalassiosira sp. AJA248-18]
MHCRIIKTVYPRCQPAKGTEHKNNRRRRSDGGSILVRSVTSR